MATTAMTHPAGIQSPRSLGVCIFVGGILLAFVPAVRAERSLADRLRNGPGTSNHPVGVAPSSSVEIPDGWPLDRNGLMTCLTCHVALPTFEGRTDPHLRGFDAETQEIDEFCARCHSDRNTQSAAAMHWSAVGVAHVRPDERVGRRSAGLLDSESRRCLGCHDGVNATESQNHTGPSRGVHFVGNSSQNHPIGVRYARGGSRGSEVALRPASLLPDEIRLPDGKVSCVSCHDLYARDRHLLTVPLDGSTLCFTCHDMK